MKNLTFLVIVLFLFSCQNQENNKSNTKEKKVDYEQLYVKTSDVIGSGDDSKRTDNVTKYEEKYFGVKLNLMDGGRYTARRDIINPESMANFRMKWQMVCDKDGTELFFDTPTDFLNFMFRKGYEVKEQSKLKYGVEYTFERK